MMDQPIKPDRFAILLKRVMLGLELFIRKIEVYKLHEELVSN